MDNDWFKHLQEGGDDRLDITDNLKNKYNINPNKYKEYFQRGSCTCSPLTIEAFNHLSGNYNKVIKDIDLTFENQRNRIAKVLDLDINVGIALAPSGSDLCYYPLLFNQLINKDASNLCLITCPEELGSGSILAYEGKYYFRRNQFNEEVAKEENISEQKISCLKFSARNKNGEIRNNKIELLDVINSTPPDVQIIVNLVIGSKSGIKDNLSVIDEVKRENITWVIDACQFRINKKLISSLLSKDCLIMITGSKFYQAPPFCGALLIPPKFQSKLTETNDKQVISSGFLNVFSKYDFPSNFKWRSQFKQYKNEGLALRWEAALYEIEQYDEIQEEDKNNYLNLWNDKICDKIKSYKSILELMPNQEKTNESIISFRVLKNNIYLTHSELKSLYNDFCSNKLEFENQEDKYPLIGQPVQYEDKSFLRLALGSQNLRSLIDNDFDLSMDYHLIDELVKRIKDA